MEPIDQMESVQDQEIIDLQVLANRARLKNRESENRAITEAVKQAKS